MTAKPSLADRIAAKTELLNADSRRVHTRTEVRKARWILAAITAVVTGLVLLVVFTKSNGTNYTGSWDTPTTVSAATQQAKSGCEIQWSLEKGGPSTYKVSHSDYITACVRAAGG